jgi:hypothetical protein
MGYQNELLEARQTLQLSGRTVSRRNLSANSARSPLFCRRRFLVPSWVLLWA